MNLELSTRTYDVPNRLKPPYQNLSEVIIICFSAFHKMTKILVGTTAPRSTHFASQFSKTPSIKLTQ